MATKKLRCPHCRHKKYRTRSDGLHQCEACYKLFDNHPEEGGDFFADPSKRLEMQERRKPKRELRGGLGR